MTLTNKQLKELEKIRPTQFKIVRELDERHLAKAIVRLDLTNLNDKVRNLLIEYFTTYRCDSRITTMKIFRNYIVEYVSLHGYGYDWGEDLSDDFTYWVMVAYGISKKSKTYQNLKNLKMNFKG